jgi:hypothetical protein
MLRSPSDTVHTAGTVHTLENFLVSYILVCQYILRTPHIAIDIRIVCGYCTVYIYTYFFHNIDSSAGCVQQLTIYLHLLEYLSFTDC